MVFKSLNELVPPYLRSLFRKNSQSASYRLRNTSTDLRLPKKSTENGKKSFSFRGARLCNNVALLLLIYFYFLIVLKVVILFLQVTFDLGFSFFLHYYCIFRRRDP